MTNIYLILLKSVSNFLLMIKILNDTDILYKTISKAYKKEDIVNKIH